MSKEGPRPGVATQLELLIGAHQHVGFSSEEEIEVPNFDDKSNLDCTNNGGDESVSLKRDSSACELEEEISDDEGSNVLFKPFISRATVSETLDAYIRRTRKQSVQCMGFPVDGKPRRPVSVGPKVRRVMRVKDKSPTTGGRWITKTRSSSHIQQHKKGPFWPSIAEGEDPCSNSDDELLDEPEALSYQPMGKSTLKILGGSGDNKMSDSTHALPVESAINHGHSGRSMVELLDDLRGKSKNLRLKSKMGHQRKERLGQHAVSQSVSSLVKANMSDDDIITSGSSTDDEKKTPNPEPVGSIRKTMAEKFEDAFGSAFMDDTRAFAVRKQSSHSGLFGRLQHVIQRQKGQDLEFLKKLQAGVCPKDKTSCIDVKIITRSFNAKLTVCQCSLLENEKSSLDNHREENFGKMEENLGNIRTIIFNLSVCGNVNLEVANFVRIHPPWKEVEVLQNDEIIILASYFSQI